MEFAFGLSEDDGANYNVGVEREVENIVSVSGDVTRPRAQRGGGPETRHSHINDPCSVPECDRE